jgi:hypothetical protein
VVPPPGGKESSSTRPTSPRIQAAGAKPKPGFVKDLVRADFETVWERPLRRALFDPPPPPPKPVEKKILPPLRVKLVATMIESDESTAVLKLAGGEVVFRKVGEMLGGDESDAKISKIEAGAVLVLRGGEECRLLVDGAKTQ